MTIQLSVVEFILSLAAVVGAFAYLLKPVRAFVKEQKHVSEAISALIQDRMNQMHRFFTQQGSIDYATMDSAEDLYEKYKKIGGNGYLDKLISDIRQLKAQ